VLEGAVLDVGDCETGVLDLAQGGPVAVTPVSDAHVDWGHAVLQAAQLLLF
jgi:hypothetical protein